MTKLAEQLKHGAGHAWDSLSEGWANPAPVPAAHRRGSAPGAAAEKEAGGSVDAVAPSRWSFMTADVFDDDDLVVVRIEAPGMQREDFDGDIDLDGDQLTVRGEKRFDHESVSDRYRVVQCACGRFRRDIGLPAPVDAGKVKASYRDGVPRIDLPKLESSRPRRFALRGD